MQAAQTNVGDWLDQYSDEPEKVREFCVRHGILNHLRTAIDLARKNFPPIEKVTVGLWTDPLEGTEMARIFVIVQDGLTEASNGYWRFLSDWTQAVPLPERDLIRFSYTYTIT
jgi:hypothetical protein